MHAYVNEAFETIFQGHIRAHYLFRSAERLLGPAARSTVDMLAGRRFRSCLPYLMLRCDSRAAPAAMICELVGVLFYLHDDLLDGKTARYGSPTALGELGTGPSLATLSEGRQRLSHFLTDLSEDLATLWEDCVHGMLTQQIMRHSVHRTSSLRDYCCSSTARVDFVGDCWKYCGLLAENALFTQLIRNSYSHCAIAGQLRNDLRNTMERETLLGGQRYSDILDGRCTAVTILLRERAQRDELDDLMSRASTAAGRLSLGSDIEALLQRYEIRRTISLLVQYEAEIARMWARDLPIGHEERILWDAWLDRQFLTGVMHDYSSTDFQRGVEFTAAIEALSRV
ncbi:polyprenyl synthetase family protein [Nocardia sp. R16R-3T]